MESTRDVQQVLDRLFEDSSDFSEDSDGDFGGEGVQGYLPSPSPSFFDEASEFGDGSEEMELGSGDGGDISSGKSKLATLYLVNYLRNKFS